MDLNEISAHELRRQPRVKEERGRVECRAIAPRECAAAVRSRPRLEGHWPQRGADRSRARAVRDSPFDGNKRELREIKGKKLSILRKERDEQEDTKEEYKYDAARDDEKDRRGKN